MGYSSHVTRYGTLAVDDVHRPRGHVYPDQLPGCRAGAFYCGYGMQTKSPYVSLVRPAAAAPIPVLLHPLAR